MRSLTLMTCVAAATFGLSATARASVIPLATGSFQLNHSTMEDQDSHDVPTITSNVLTITNLGHSDANSAFYTTPVSLAAPFIAQFTYQATNPDAGGSGATQYGADGTTFTIMSTANPLTSIGGRGSGLGWGNNDSGGQRPGANFIPNSVAVELTDYQAFQTGVVSAGPTGGSAGNYTTAPGLIFSDPTTVTITYTGTTVGVSLLDQTNGATFTLPTQNVSLTGVVGTSGYIGFTAGSGGDSSVETISNLTISPVPEPASIGLLAVGGAGLLARRRRA